MSIQLEDPIEVGVERVLVGVGVINIVGTTIGDGVRCMNGLKNFGAVARRILVY